MNALYPPDRPHTSGAPRQTELAHVGQHLLCFANGELSRLAREDADAAILFAVLREANNRPLAEFWIGNDMTQKFGPPWSRKRLAAARRKLIERNYVELIKKAAPHSPALYRWAIRR